MDSHHNKQLVMQAYGLYSQGDIKGVLDLCTDQVCWTSADIAQVPFSGTYHGRYEVGEFFASLAGNMDTVHFTPRDFIAEGDKVVVTGTAHWHVKSTGADFGSDWVHVFTVRDDKITRFEQYTDTAAAQAAFRGAPAAQAGAPALHH
ncbi:nuclear transport factor 2 family protein [Massilia sp. DWR3-1-1]|uniref:nuclear transport factor 2 family protein n=1 Tax=Massilia sp. DWR3-1-1 TaxID=2804559 RepID=UPI003CF069D6